jgi:DNA-binding transcriptional MerR regulator
MSATTARDQDLLTIGAVCEQLRPDFPDISISKIRYLEGEGLLRPKRTQGGYRLFSEEDVDRLQTILRLQRDEFLPLRVIREELASPRTRDDKRKRADLTAVEEELDVGELCSLAGIDAALARELEDFGLLLPRVVGGARVYTQSDAEIAQTCGRLARVGISPRHLRTFRTAADRQAALVEALVAPGLRSRNAERRRQAVADVRQVGELAQDLAQRLFWRAIRGVVT